MRTLFTMMFSLFFSFSVFAQQEARLVKDIQAGMDSSFDYDFFPEDDGVKATFADKILFVVDEPGSFYSLWISDGQEANTVALLSDLDAFPIFDNSDTDWLYFTTIEDGDDKLYGLNKSDLTLTELYSSGDFIKALAVQGDDVYLAVDNLLVKANASTQTTETIYEFGSFRKIKDVNVFGDNLIIIGGEDNGVELYFSDGTTSGTQPYFQLNEPDNSDFSRDYFMTEVGNQLFFFYNKPSEPYILFRTDGTAEGTLPLVELENITFYEMEARKSIIGFDGKLFFQGRQLGNSQGQHELFVSDGTVEGTQILTVSEFNVASDPSDFTVYKDELYFVCDEAGGIYTIYKTDGTQDGTVRVIDRNELGSGLSLGGQFMTVFQDSLYFYGYRYEYGEELWVSAGSTATTRVIDLTPGEAGNSPSQMMATDNYLFFAYRSPEFGKELFVLDDIMVNTKDLVSGVLEVYPNPLGNELLQISLPDDITFEQAQLQVFDHLGRVVLNQDFAKEQLDLAVLPTGFYVLTLTFDGKMYTTKLLKE